MSDYAMCQVRIFECLMQNAAHIRTYNPLQKYGICIRPASVLLRQEVSPLLLLFWTNP